MGKRKLNQAIEMLATSAKRASDAIDEAITFVDASNVRINEMDANASCSALERQRRQAAVDTARASIELERFRLTEDELNHAQRFIDGEITLDEFVQGKVLKRKLDNPPRRS